MAAPMSRSCFWLSNIFRRQFVTFSLRLSKFETIRCPTHYFISNRSPSHLIDSSNGVFCSTGRRLFSSKVVSTSPPRINVGTIGHVDHGKTTLTAAITKVLTEQGRAKFMRYEDIDRAPEERNRGITINACHVGYSTAKRDYAHTDCPGHIDYIKNMIVGTSQMDGVILVVAATDGTMPQTQEHLMLAKQIGVTDLVVYINKVDAVDNDLVDLVELEIRELATDVGYDGDNIPVISGSALCALNGTKDEIGRDSILKLMDVLDNHIQEPKRNEDGPFIMPIEKAVVVPGRGTVVIGTPVQGTVQRSDPAVILGFDREFKTAVTSIGRFDGTLESAPAGTNVGLLVKGVKKEAIQRGMYLCHRDAGVTQHNAMKAQVYVRMKSEGGRSKPITQKYINTMFMDISDISACMMLPEGQTLLMPGETVETEVLLRVPMVVREGQKFFIRDGPATTISGVVLKTLPRSSLEIKGFNIDMRSANKVNIESNTGVVRKKMFERMEKSSAKQKRTR